MEISDILSDKNREIKKIKNAEDNQIRSTLQELTGCLEQAAEQIDNKNKKIEQLLNIISSLQNKNDSNIKEINELKLHINELEKEAKNKKEIEEKKKEDHNNAISNNNDNNNSNTNTNTNNTSIKNINNYSNNFRLSAKKKSSNRINAVINKYLEIKQDADEFLEKLNKKKNDMKNKYNKYNILIKKKHSSKISNDMNFNMINNYKNITSNSTILNTSKKNNNNTIINSNKKNEEYKNSQIMKKENDENENNNELEVDLDINIEYQKMINQIEELEQIKMDYNSYNHLNQIKKYINEKGENINLDDIRKINNELIKMIEIIDKKEKLKQTLENYNLKIEQDKQMLNELNAEDNYDKNEYGMENNDNYENEINYNDVNVNNNINDNNQYIDEVEEEYENELSTKKLKDN